MNVNQIVGPIKAAVGQLQEWLGGLTGSTSQRAKGLLREVNGRAQKMAGDAQALLESSQQKP